MDNYGEAIIAMWLAFASFFALLILIGFTIASIFISFPLWVVTLCAVGGGVLLSTAAMIGWGRR